MLHNNLYNKEARAKNKAIVCLQMKIRIIGFSSPSPQLFL